MPCTSSDPELSQTERGAGKTFPRYLEESRSRDFEDPGGLSDFPGAPHYLPRVGIKNPHSMRFDLLGFSSMTFDS